VQKTLLKQFGRRIRLGIVGGGLDSVIGSTHLAAMRVDGFCELVAGAMSVDPDVARASAEAELLDPDRSYTDYREMAEREALRQDGIDAVVIATPPHVHFPVARAFLARGIDVVCEKPMTRDLGEALKLVDQVRATGRLFCLTHCYTGYPMVRQARAMIAAGALGAVRLIDVEFAAGDKGVVAESDDPTRRHWHFKAGVMGKGVLLGEVGSHAHHLASYLTGLQATEVAADLTTVAARREVYDNAYLTVRFEQGVRGRLWSSFVAAGNNHGLAFRVFGDEGALLWHQESPEVLVHQRVGQPSVQLTRGLDSLSEASLRATRFRPGHPEGYALAFANLYRDFAQAVMARSLGLPYDPYVAELPGVAEGARGMKFIEAAMASHERGGAWTDVWRD